MENQNSRPLNPHEVIAAYAVIDINSVPRRFNVTVHILDRSGAMVRLIQHDCRTRAECPGFAKQFAESQGAVQVFESEKDGLPMPPKSEMVAPLPIPVSVIQNLISAFGGTKCMIIEKLGAAFLESDQDFQDLAKAVKAIQREVRANGGETQS